MITNADGRVSAAETVLVDDSSQQIPEAEAGQTGQAKIVFQSDPFQLSRAKLDRMTKTVHPSTLPLGAGLDEGLDVPEPEEMSQTRFWCYIAVICLLPSATLLAVHKSGVLLDRDPSPDPENGRRQRARQSELQQLFGRLATIDEESFPDNELEEIVEELGNGRQGSTDGCYKSYIVIEDDSKGPPSWKQIKTS